MLRPVILSLLAASTAFAAPPFVRIEGDRVTVIAKQTPLRDILAQFAHAGVDVLVDPSIDILVTGSCRYTPMEEALCELLRNHAYILEWELVRGPLGDIPRLTEMQVFQPGRREAAKPIAAPRGPLQVTRGPAGGPLFVADEILVAARGGTRVDEFRLLLAQIGGTVVESIPSLGIYRVRLPPGTNVPDLVNQLARNPILDTVEPNYAERLPAGVGPAAEDVTPAVRAPPSDANAAPLAILDSGLMSGIGIDGLVKGSYDALDPARSISDPVGHGSQMALVASGAVSPTGVETAPTSGVPVLAVRTFDDNGLTSNFALMRALDYAIAQGARVVNLSWGTETPSAFVRESVAYAQSKGLLVVAAAGNEPSGKPFYPAALPGVVAVAALDETGAPWSQSNHGDFITLAAPGRATLPVGYTGPPGAYAGTSIASAFVARELALYFTRHPGASAAQARSAVLGALSPPATSARSYGSGRLDDAALQRLRSAP